MTTAARIALFGVLSGLVWSSAPSYFIGTPSFQVFLLYALAGIVTSLVVSFSLYRPLLRFRRWGSFVVGIIALPLGAFCFGFVFALIGVVVGDVGGRVTWANPFNIAILFACVTVLASFFSWWGFILVPSALLTTYLLRLTILHRRNSRDLV